MENYLKELIAMPTISLDREANNKALDYMQRFFEERQLFVERYTFNGYGSLVATTKKGHKTPKVLLTAHMDVVPGPKSLFTLREEDGKYIGRGVFDMKFAIASYMQIVDSLGDKLRDYDLGIMITTDEEIGGANGAVRLIEEGYKADICILPDGAENWEIEVLAKGLWWAHITVSGQTAHGSRPWEGDSASFRIIELLHELKQYFANQAPMTDSLNIGIIAAGEATNQVPDSATADIDIRYLSQDSLTTIMQRFDALCAKYNATYEVKVSGLPCINSLDNPYVAQFKTLIEQEVGTSPKGIVANGGTDGRFFTAIGVPCVISSPVGGGRHSDEEWASKEGLEQFTAVLKKYLDKVAHSQP